jgi:hypothetical protein
MFFIKYKYTPRLQDPINRLSGSKRNTNPLSSENLDVSYMAVTLLPKNGGKNRNVRVQRQGAEAGVVSGD